MARTATKPHAPAPATKVPDPRQIDLEEAIERAATAPALPALVVIPTAPVSVLGGGADPLSRAMASAMRRLQHLDAEIATLNQDKAAVFRELKELGVNPGIFRRILREKRIDPLVLEQQQILVAEYRRLIEAGDGE
jgi:uncharacterized protein (UPF0335 family)